MLFVVTSLLYLPLHAATIGLDLTADMIKPRARSAPMMCGLEKTLLLAVAVCPLPRSLQPPTSSRWPAASPVLQVRAEERALALGRQCGGGAHGCQLRRPVLPGASKCSLFLSLFCCFWRGGSSSICGALQAERGCCMQQRSFLLRRCSIWLILLMPTRAFGSAKCPLL